MTAQMCEIVRYGGEDVLEEWLLSSPALILDRSDYERMGLRGVPSFYYSTACGRGFVSTYLIEGDELRILSVSNFLPREEFAGKNNGRGIRVDYSGSIVIRRNNVRSGYDLRTYRHLEIESGRVIRDVWKLWLDDQLGEVEGRNSPFGWTEARSSEDAIRLVGEMGVPAEMDLDHDLGGGDDALVFLGRLNEMGLICSREEFPKWRVHSENPIGRDRIGSYLSSWERSLG